MKRHYQVFYFHGHDSQGAHCWAFYVQAWAQATTSDRHVMKQCKYQLILFSAGFGKDYGPEAFCLGMR